MTAFGRLSALAVLLFLVGCGPADSVPAPEPGPDPLAACRNPDAPYVLEPPVPESGAREQNLRAWVELLASPRTGGRRSGTGDTDPPALAVARALRAAGLLPGDGHSFCNRFEIQGSRDRNVVARSAPAPRLLVVAHCDGQGRRPTGEPLPGADDNASGVAVMLEFARLAARESRERASAGTSGTPPFAVAALTGEEIGRLGADRFLAAPPFDLDSVERVVVLDMVGRPRSGLGFQGFRSPSSIAEAAARADIELSPLADFGDRRPGRTDADVFGRQLPTVLLSTGLHADYHEVGDLPERLDYVFLGRLVEMLLHLWSEPRSESAVQSGP